MTAELKKTGRHAIGWALLVVGGALALCGGLTAFIGIFGAGVAVVYGNWTGHSGVWFNLISIPALAAPLAGVGYLLCRLALRMTRNGQSAQSSTNAT